MRKYALACTAAVALLAAAEPRASAWCQFEISFGFNVCCGRACPTCGDCCCGWPGCPLDAGCPDGFAGGYPVADYGYPAPAYGYGAPAYGYPAPAATPGPATQPAPSFPPPPKPADDKQTSYRGYSSYPYQQTGYGYGTYGYSQAPSYWYGR
jgi:hypothetical protein